MSGQGRSQTFCINLIFQDNVLAPITIFILFRIDPLLKYIVVLLLRYRVQQRLLGLVSRGCFRLPSLNFIVLGLKGVLSLQLLHYHFSYAHPTSHLK